MTWNSGPPKLGWATAHHPSPLAHPSYPGGWPRPPRAPMGAGPSLTWTTELRTAEPQSQAPHSGRPMEALVSAPLGLVARAGRPWWGLCFPASDSPDGMLLRVQSKASPLEPTTRDEISKLASKQLML